MSASRCPGRRIVYVVDDEAGVRISVSDMIEDLGYDGSSFNNGAELLGALDRLEPGCILLDIEMPGRSGFDVMSDLSRLDCAWPVVAMTAHGDIPMAVKAMKLGAFDFIEKPFSRDSLQSLLMVADADWRSRRDEKQAQQDVRQRIKALTPREQDVLKGISEGKQNKILAFDLGLSIRTVEMHRSNMLTKLGLRTAQEAVAMLIQSGVTISHP